MSLIINFWVSMALSKIEDYFVDYYLQIIAATLLKINNYKFVILL